MEKARLSLLSKDQHVYQQVDASDEDLSMISELEAESLRSLQAIWRRQTRWLYIISILNGIVIIANIVFFVTSFRLRSIIKANMTAAMVGGYSPILESMDIKLKNVQFNGSLYPPPQPAFSRLEPGDPIGEEMWQSFEPTPVFPITREQLIGIGKDPETAVKFPDEVFGLGDEAYVAALDVTHKLHCLNELRKMTFVDYPTLAKQPTHEHGKLWWYHLRHCTDMLAQDLMCHADSDLLTYNFRDTQIHPFPDFSVNRQCRDFDQLLDWRDSHALNLTTYVETVRYESSKGTRLIPYEREFYEMHGFTGSILFPEGRGFDEYWAEQWI